MRTLTRWKVAVLTGALLGGACSKEPASAPAEAPRAAPAGAPTSPAPQGQADSEAEAEASASPETPAPAPKAGGAQGPDDFKEGQSRDEVMALFGDCAERKIFLPGGNGALYVEVYQPKDSEECYERLGKRQFTIRGGELFRVTDGLIARQEAPSSPPPEGT
ncbi:hypothetical protein POL68_31620 [Stigmatella sp. ncwal1]|uniref:Lipoprotein n=1 Tax=Stigmatella ashevillensis TaxID=2995309 RepID=A0ABT5DHB2_9BACT|nr:hypothetical protein [Stigmatella ashevillena]MDC0713054.1 hypothetical protein [Stigmatella ashevillena]